MSGFLGRLRRRLSVWTVQVGTVRPDQTPFAERTRRRLARLERRADRIRARQQRTNQAVAALSREVTALRTAQQASERRVMALSRFVTLLHDGITADGGRAVELSGRLLAVPATAAETAGIVHLLTDLGHALVADRVARARGGVETLPRALQLRLHDELRARGYLLRAMTYLEAVASSGLDRDRQLLEQRSSEVEVMSGAFRPVVAGEALETVPGRVLHVVGFSLPMRQTGYTIRTHQTARAQVAAGLEPHVVTQAGNAADDLPREVTLEGVHYHHVGGPGRTTMKEWLQRNTEEVAAVVRRVRPSVLHAHSDFLNFLTAQAVGRALGLPVVYEARGFWEESWLSRTADRYGWAGVEEIVELFGMPEAYTWRRDREVEARSEADHVVTLSRTMAVRIGEAEATPVALTLAPNAVDAEEFSGTQRDASLSAELDVRADDVVIGYISSLVEYEGIETLIEAFGLLRAVTAQPVRLLVVGDGPERSRLEELARRQRVEGVTFTGQVSHHDVPRYYSLIDVFVVPRRPHRVCHLVTPLKPFEAFASGCAVVVSDVEALREIADDSGGAALPFEAGNPRSLAEVLQGLVEDADRRQQLARAGREWVRSTRTWRANARTYVQVYDALGVPIPAEAEWAGEADRLG
jgi:glycosyltransferase involved in cell wall biosynthesis